MCYIVHINEPTHGNLENWAKQGVLLLNTVLTVRQGQANSHKGIGWEVFTDAAIEAVNAQQSNVVFMLWGKHAEAKMKLLDPTRHLILTAPHPSPLSAHRGFFDSNHFSKANQYLVESGRSAIDWNL